MSMNDRKREKIMNKKKKEELEKRTNAILTLIGAKTAICNLIGDKEHTFRDGLIEYTLVNQDNLSPEETTCIVMGLGNLEEEVLDSCPEDFIPDEIIWQIAKFECTKEQQEILLTKLNLEEVE